MPFEVTTSPPVREISPEGWKFRALFGRERDKADRLPAPGKEKLMALRSALDDARAVKSIPYQRMQDTRQKADQVELRLAQLRNGATPYANNHPLVVAERESLEGFRAQMRDLSQEHERRNAVSAALEELVKRLEDYTASLPQSGVAAAPAIQPKTLKSETPADAVARLRAAIDEADNALFDAIHAPIKSDAAKAIMRRHIEELAERGRPNVLATIEGRQPPVFSQAQGRVVVVINGAGDISTGESPDVFDAESTFSWLHKDALIAAMERAIDEDADDTDALDDSTRAKRIAQAKAGRLSAEREEEFFIVAAAQTGMPIQRRPNADPRAILQLADSAPQPRDD